MTLRRFIAAVVLFAGTANAGWDYSGGPRDECVAEHDGLQFLFRDDVLHVRTVGRAPRTLHEFGLRWTPSATTVERVYAVTVKTSADGFATRYKIPVAVENGSAVFEWNRNWWDAASHRATATVEIYYHGNTNGGRHHPSYTVRTLRNVGSLPITRRLQACRAAQVDDMEQSAAWGAEEDDDS